MTPRSEALGEALALARRLPLDMREDALAYLADKRLGVEHLNAFTLGAAAAIAAEKERLAALPKVKNGRHREGEWSALERAVMNEQAAGGKVSYTIVSMMEALYGQGIDVSQTAVQNAMARIREKRMRSSNER